MKCPGLAPPGSEKQSKDGWTKGPPCLSSADPELNVAWLSRAGQPRLPLTGVKARAAGGQGPAQARWGLGLQLSLQPTLPPCLPRPPIPATSGPRSRPLGGPPGRLRPSLTSFPVTAHPHSRPATPLPQGGVGWPHSPAVTALGSPKHRL